MQSLQCLLHLRYNILYFISMLLCCWQVHALDFFILFYFLCVANFQADFQNKHLCQEMRVTRGPVCMRCH